MVLFAGRVLREAEALLAGGRRREAFLALRRLSFAQLGRLLQRVPGRYPALQATLPVMPSEGVQRDWTGTAGRPLRAQTTAFTRSLERAFQGFCGRPLRDVRVLDYGCGWGRILRLMCRVSAPDDLYGVDAVPESIEICRGTRVPGHLAVCDHLPRELPFAGVTFDVVYAFSLFTHLSEKAGRAVLQAVRRRIAEDGLLALTVRPEAYWAAHARSVPGLDPGGLRARHQAEGFAFLPHNRPPIDGEVTFGDTSIALDYVRRQWTEWELLAQETNRQDPYQRILFLRPR